MVMNRVFHLLILVAVLFAGIQQQDAVKGIDGRLIDGRRELAVGIFDSSSGGNMLLSYPSLELEFRQGSIQNLSDLIPEHLRSRSELWIEVSGLTSERIRLVNATSDLYRERPEDTAETTEEMATHLRIGRVGGTDDLVVHSPRAGFGVETPTERIDVGGAIAIREGSSPTSTTDVGKVYVNDADGHLYFIDEAGNITDLTVDANAVQSVSSSANHTGRVEHMRFIPGDYTDITESATDDTIYIRYDVGCSGTSGCSSAPSSPSRLDGATTVCTGEPGAAYAVPPVSGASYYIWSIPTDAVITDGLGSNSVNVVFGSTDGAVCAQAHNDCGTSSPICLSVSLNRPTSPGSITGTSPVCPGQTGVSYYITSVPGATNYIWTLPPGAVLASGTGTPNITVNFGTSGGDICVQTENSCGVSTPVCMPVVMTATPSTPGVISGDGDVCGGDTDVGYSITPVADATSYTWTVPSGASISAGDGTSSITIDFGTTSGSVCVTASSICGTSSSSCKSVTVTNPPSTPGSISGNSVVPPSTTDESYSITPVTGATSYLWTVSGDASIDGSATNPNVNIDFGTSSGTEVELCVTASNGCGTSSPRCDTVTIAEPSGSVTFNYTGSQQSWTVPSGITTVTIECYGAQGGNSGGEGGYASADYPVTPGSTLYIYVGGTNGYNGGGTGGADDGVNRNGGGASDVRFGGTALSNRVVVAGGGGGEGGWPGGLGGNGSSCSNGRGGGYGEGYETYGGNGDNGTCTSGGAGGTGYGGHGGGGGGGGLTSAGQGGTNGGYGTSGYAGSLGTGGNYGPNNSYGCHTGGGGGGGYYGGGGGATGQCAGGGGGGGSSWAHSSTSSRTFTGGVRTGNGQVIISW